MRLLVAYLVLIHIVLGVSIYRSRSAPTHREKYIAERRELLRVADANKPPNSIVFLGDSLTESLATSNIPNAVNYGIGWSTTHDLNERMSDYDFSTASVVLMIGTNDANMGIAPERINLPDVAVLWYAAPNIPSEGFKKQCAEHPKCRFIELDFGHHFLPDGVHLDPEGHKIWLESLHNNIRP
jgi:lysophospholipase L1-like esterase